jgi:hypothetical protein
MISFIVMALAVTERDMIREKDNLPTLITNGGMINANI